jgi:hypothetical protein
VSSIIRINAVALGLAPRRNSSYSNIMVGKKIFPCLFLAALLLAAPGKLHADLESFRDYLEQEEKAGAGEEETSGGKQKDHPLLDFFGEIIQIIWIYNNTYLYYTQGIGVYSENKA